jgi:hypothetical protein
LQNVNTIEQKLILKLNQNFGDFYQIPQNGVKKRVYPKSKLSFFAKLNCDCQNYFTSLILAALPVLPLK